MTIAYRFIRPVDVLYLRGNRLFGEAGEHAEAEMPPWPSLFAGAIRSRIIADRGIPFHDFAAGRCDDDAARPVLGTPEKPGSFRLTHLGLAWVRGDSVEPLVLGPADLVVHRPPDAESTGEGEPGGRRGPERLHATQLMPVPRRQLGGAISSGFLPAVPVLRGAPQDKPLDGIWLRRAGIAAYQRGDAVPDDALVRSSDLWDTDPRLGIGLNPGTRTATEGMIYTTDTVALCSGVGFLVGVGGANDILPEDGLLRLGGDGRGATIEPWTPEEPEPWRGTPTRSRFRMILATPGIFPSGWLPPGIVEAGDKLELRLHGFAATLVAAALPRHHVVSGWDLAKREPKPAVRAVPAGAVYWFERTAGDLTALGGLLEDGLWCLVDESVLSSDTQRLMAARRAEGFNNVWFADGHGLSDEKED